MHLRHRKGFENIEQPSSSTTRMLRPSRLNEPSQPEGVSWILIEFMRDNKLKHQRLY